MTNAPKIFDMTARPHRRRRATKNGMFLQTLARDEIMLRLQEVNRSFTKPLVITDFADLWQDHFDHIMAPADDLAIQPQAHDLIIHDFCLHHMNDPIVQLIQPQR